MLRVCCGQNSTSVLRANGCHSLGVWFNGRGLHISATIFAKLTDNSVDRLFLKAINTGGESVLLQLFLELGGEARAELQQVDRSL